MLHLSQLAPFISTPERTFPSCRSWPRGLAGPHTAGVIKDGRSIPPHGGCCDSLHPHSAITHLLGSVEVAMPPQCSPHACQHASTPSCHSPAWLRGSRSPGRRRGPPPCPRWPPPSKTLPSWTQTAASHTYHVLPLSIFITIHLDLKAISLPMHHNAHLVERSNGAPVHIVCICRWPSCHGHL